MAALQNKHNVNKNKVEYILRLHLVPTRSAFDNAQRHVTAFRPISEAAAAARSWSCQFSILARQMYHSGF